MKPFRRLTLGLMLASCAEPPARDVDSVSVVVSVQPIEASAQRVSAISAQTVPLAVTARAEASASSTAPNDRDEQMKQQLIRALDKAREDAKKPKPPRPAGSTPQCDPTNPLCDM